MLLLLLRVMPALAPPLGLPLPRVFPRLSVLLVLVQRQPQEPLCSQAWQKVQRREKVRQQQPVRVLL